MNYKQKLKELHDLRTTIADDMGRVEVNHNVIYINSQGSLVMPEDMQRKMLQASLRTPPNSLAIRITLP